MKPFQTKCHLLLAGLMCLALPVLSWADVVNTAKGTYLDSAGTKYNVTSNTVTVTTPPVITLTKSADVTTAKPGDTVTFTIAYQNSPASAAGSVVITDVIPTGTTLVAGSITGGGTASGGTITWNLGTVAGGASGQVSFKVTVN